MRRMLWAGAGFAALLGLGGAAAAQDAGAPPPPMRDGMMRGGMGKMLEQRFAEMDTNHDGAVTRPEYDAYRAKMRADRQARMGERGGRPAPQGYDAPPPPPPSPPGSPPLGYDPTGGAAPPPPPGGDMAPPPGGPGGGMAGRPGGPGGMRMGPDWFDRADANHDGKVTLAEARAAMRAMMSERRGMRDRGGPAGDMPPPPPQ